MVNKLLVTGGIRSGKTGLAEQRAKAAGNDVVYVATATAGDDEMALRIQRHQELRPDHWQLAEEPLRLHNRSCEWTAHRALVVKKKEQLGELH